MTPSSAIRYRLQRAEWLALLICNGSRRCQWRWDRRDIAVALNSSRVILRLENGNGRFQPPQQFVAGLGSNSVALVDVNGDGKIDVVTAIRSADYFSVLLGNGTGNFQP